VSVIPGALLNSGLVVQKSGIISNLTTFPSATGGRNRGELSETGEATPDRLPLMASY
jgi:hypothetical protein